MKSKWKLGLAVVFVAACVGMLLPKFERQTLVSSMFMFAPNVNARQEVCFTRPKNMLSIRMLILRHTTEQMAMDDANAAIKAVEGAAAKGLDIKVVGNHLYTKIDSEFIKEQMKINRTPGDTFIVYTVGHGSPQGTLQHLGKRSDMMAAIANAASANKQETLWWQLSCYSASGMPPIESLTEEQKSKYSNLVSSPANQLSYTMVQARIMVKLFDAMVDDNSTLDANKDNVLTAQELRNFLDTVDQAQRSKLFYSLTPDEVVFNERIIYHTFPIVDLSSSGSRFTEGYIPISE